jgi:hypothetical protein
LLGHAEEVNGLCDTEQGGDHNHSAQAALEEGGDAFALECFTVDDKNINKFL